MSAAATAPPQGGRVPSFLAAVRRLLWDAGYRSSSGPSPSPPADLGRKRPREEEEEEGEEGAGTDGAASGEEGHRGETIKSGGPPHLARSAAKQARRQQQQAASAVSLVSSDEESAGEECAAKKGGAVVVGGGGGGAPPPAKRARTAGGAVATASSPQKSAAPRVAAVVCSPCASPRPSSPRGGGGRAACAPAGSAGAAAAAALALALPLPLQQRSPLLRAVPPEVLSSDVLSYLPTSGDRFALQLTCRQFKAATDRQPFLAKLDIGGAGVEGRRGLLLDGDTAPSAVRKLLPFSRAGNMQAIYMLGMLKAYCFDSPKHGIALLRMCASQGYARAAYALGLILRDSSREESRHWLSQAAKTGYLPAYQELLPAQEVKAKYGDLDAERLRGYLDFPCLNRLLGRHYVDSNPRCVQTSHCWNPLCGRWAYKATPSVDQYLRRREVRARRRAERDGPGDAAEDDSFTAYSLFSLLRDTDAGAGANVGPNAGAGGLPLEGQGQGQGQGQGAAARASRTVAAPGGRRAGGQPPSIPLPGDAARANPRRADARALLAAAPQPQPPRPDGDGGADGNAGGDGTGDGNGNDDDSDGSGGNGNWILRVSRMKMCSSCRRAKYCSKLCQVYDWRSGRHKTECQYLG